MIPLTLYWNHICVLHRQEKAFLEFCAEQLLAEGIQLSVRYFGLGYPMHLSDYLAKPDAILPDLIVSADMEVFEDPRIACKFSEKLYPIADWIPLRDSAALRAVWKNRALLPFVSIPLVYFTADSAAETDATLPDLIFAKGARFSFGGIRNSAGKCLVKAVWNHYGKDAASQLLQRSLVTDMPIGAFQAVRTGQAQTALVPSLYALRADGSKFFLKRPMEGPLLVSSYVCARQSAPQQAVKQVLSRLLSTELCGFYAKNGDLIVHPARTKSRSSQEADTYFVPDRSFLLQLAPREFYELYERFLPLSRSTLSSRQEA